MLQTVAPVSTEQQSRNSFPVLTLRKHPRADRPGAPRQEAVLSQSVSDSHWFRNKILLEYGLVPHFTYRGE